MIMQNRSFIDDTEVTLTEVLRKHLGEFIMYMKANGVMTDPLPKLVINKIPQCTDCITNKTAYYDPQNKTIVLYVHGRHPKDVLRSFSHEMVHHDQNMNGLMGVEYTGKDQYSGLPDNNYAQNNNHLRGLEKDAYLRGNMLFRDYTDTSNSLKEINIDIEKGDILLGGRFRNKKIKVKTIGTDDMGQPTVNGNQILKVRIQKLIKQVLNGMQKKGKL